MRGKTCKCHFSPHTYKSGVTYTFGVFASPGTYKPRAEKGAKLFLCDPYFFSCVRGKHMIYSQSETGNTPPHGPKTKD